MSRRIQFAWGIVLAMSLPLLADSPAEKLLEKSDDWFRSEEGRSTLNNVLSWQTEHGDWPKNMDTTARPYSGEGEKPAGTFDNGATCDELRVLARAYQVTGEERYKEAFVRGLDHILEAQYANGGWPQYYPLSKGYQRHITFNDYAMIRLMKLLHDVGSEAKFKFVDDNRRDAARTAVQRGIECIVKCQIVVDGDLTVWCAQHDAETLQPGQARSFEPASLSGAESAGILNFLMNLDEPSPQVIAAVKAGVAWFDSAKIEGFRYKRSENDPALVADATAPPIWARFYEIESNRPIFSDRDGVVKYDIEEIGSERRNGYAWYGNWGISVQKNHAKWPHR